MTNEQIIDKIKQLNIELDSIRLQAEVNIAHRNGQIEVLQSLLDANTTTSQAKVASPTILQGEPK